MKKCIINGITYEFCAAVRDNGPLRNSLNALARLIYSFDFEEWYKAGYWDDNYRPYVLALDGQVVAVASANTVYFRFGARLLNYVQIGTVMTHPQYRGRGLSRWLLERILHDWRDNCDSVYLYANDSVLDFYPKFGFVQTDEYQHVCVAPPPAAVKARKLNINNAWERALLLQIHAMGNPYARLGMADNRGLVMFHCLFTMRNSIWYIEAYNTVVIAECLDEVLLCYDIFGPGAASLNDVFAAVADSQTRRVVCGFTPIPPTGCKADLRRAENDTFFVLKGKENLFNNDELMLPLLSRA